MSNQLYAAFDAGSDSDLVEKLEPWLRQQRWFPAKKQEVSCSPLGWIDMNAEPWVRVLLVAVKGDGTNVVLQVPLVLTFSDPNGKALIWHNGFAVHDGTSRPEFIAAWFNKAEVVDPRLRYRINLQLSKVITGEQSNTSVVLSGPDGPVGMLKVFRSLAPGDNPDVDVPRRLVEQGWDGVPVPLGWMNAIWPGTDEPGCLGVLTEFLVDATDGFTVAVDCIQGKKPFAGMAYELGSVVADMHKALLEAYGPTPGDPGLAHALQERFEWAIQQVPNLAEYRDAVETWVQKLDSRKGLPSRQRVHGDLHLGQVLWSDRWFVIDFEGEPLAPIEARIRPDLALRDVAGIMRSFDYAAAVGGLTGTAAENQVALCRAAFWSGYCKATGQEAALWDLTDVLAALELDKVLYEIVYESRNRPDWVKIPMAGLIRLLANDL